MGFFSKLKEGLTKTRDNIVSGIDSVFSGFSSIDDDFYDELEETLIMGDIGVVATEEILDDLKAKVKENKIKNPADCKQLLIDSIKEKMDLGENAYEFENRKSIVMLIGVNGVGKTTSVGKLAGLLKAQNKKVIMAAADTFRVRLLSSLQSGLTEQVLILLHRVRALIRLLLYMIQLLHVKPEKQMFFYVIQQDVFRIRRILWKSFVRLTEL